MDLGANPSILVILMGSIGDVARGVSIVAPIKLAYPQSRITWLIEPKCRALIELVKGIDEVLIFERKQGLSAVLKIYKELRKKHFDLTLDLQRHLKSGLFSWFSHAPRRIGFSRADSKEFNWAFNTEHIPDFGEELPKIEHYQKFLEQIGIQVLRPFNFGIDRARMAQYLPVGISGLKGPYITMVLGSTWETKDWFLESYQSLIDTIAVELKLPIVLVGDRSKHEMGEKLARPGVINLVDRTDLKQLLAVLGGSLLALGPDSGPGHMAAMLGVPYVALFGPTDPKRTAPYEAMQFVVRSGVECSPCYLRKCPGLNEICMRRITPEMVMEKVRLAVNARTI